MSNHRTEKFNRVLNGLVTGLPTKAIATTVGVTEQYVRDIKKRCIETVTKVKDNVVEPGQKSFRFGRKNQYD
jgi:hypothetical protein